MVFRLFSSSYVNNVMGKLPMNQRSNIGLVQHMGYADVSRVTSQPHPDTDPFVKLTPLEHFYPQSSAEEEKGPTGMDVDEALDALDSGELIADPVQAGAGILDIGASVLKGAATAAAAWTAAKAVAKGAAQVGTTVAGIATGPKGTAVSNYLSEKFNKNPDWRPGFPGEAHLVLPTDFGLTRANFAGPGTNLGVRQARGDIGVDGPMGIDAASKIHDILYSIAQTPADIRQADDILIRDIQKGSQGPKFKAFAIKMIQAKKFGEDAGVFGPETFTKLEGLHGSGYRGMLSTPISKWVDRVEHDVARTIKKAQTQSQLVTQHAAVAGCKHLPPGRIKDVMCARARLQDVGRVTQARSGLNIGSRLPDVGHRSDVARQIGHGLGPAGSGLTTAGNGLELPGQGFQRMGVGVKTDLRALAKDIVASTAKVRLPADILKAKLLKQLKQSGFTRKSYGGSGIGLGRSAKPGLPHKLRRPTDMRGTSVNAKGHSIGIQPGQQGGFLGLLAGLAASFVVPAIIKAFKKK